MDRETDCWMKHWRIGRLQFGWRIYCHHYWASSDRWVVHPFLVYDRKPDMKEGERH